jgi:hypothetical protein
MAGNISKFILLQNAMKRLFSPRYILATNTVASGALMGLGDWIVQQVEQSENSHKSDQCKTSGIDWNRTGISLFCFIHYLVQLCVLSRLPKVASVITKVSILDRSCACNICVKN